MGGGKWSDDTYKHISANYSTKSTNQIFTSTKMDSSMSPKDVQFRESRDSDEHPQSLAISVYLDVTGSMDRIPGDLIKNKLGALMSTIIKHGVEHPQIMFSAIGDHYSDKAPIQIGQFESSTEAIDTGLTKIWLEQGGGGQGKESYALAWYFNARHTSIDCMEKRGEKGFLFTIGDEANHSSLSPDAIRSIFGDAVETDITDKQLLEEVSRNYHVFHIHINEASYKDNVLGYWKDLLGERLLILDDYTTVGELIASTVALVHGADLNTITKDFDSKIAGTVTKALAKVTTITKKDKGGVVKL